MSKHFSKKRRIKYVLLALTCAASFSAAGFSACAKDPEDKKEEDKTSAVDNQLLKNGNFEFFTVPKAEEDENEPVYLINSPNNWSHGGSSSYTMSGIIDTNKSAWDLLNADDLEEKLDINNALNSSDSNYKEDYVDYNGMKSSDLLYKDSYSALKTSSIESEEVDGKKVYKLDDKEVFLNEDDGEYYFDAEFTKPLKEKIGNPGTHYVIEGDAAEGYYYMDGEDKVTVYKDDKGDFYLKYDENTKEYSETFTNVLMLHNYSSSNHNGIAQNYSSISVDLPANTAAEISLWVKTGDLLFRQGTPVTQDRGAYIAVSQSVGGTTLDDFKISSINTEKLIADKSAPDSYNGWVQYSVFVNACDFASTTITIKLGLGDTNYTVEGYAFFDDVKVTKYGDLSDKDCNYDKNKVDDAICYLSSKGDEKVFIADKYSRNEGAVTDKRFSENFDYFVDLASESKYDIFEFGGASLKANLTVDKDKYVSSAVNNATADGITVDNALGKVKLPDELKNIKDGNDKPVGINTQSDLLAFVPADKKFANSEYSAKLNDALTNAQHLPGADKDSKVLVMLSARGAAYTTSFDLSIEQNSRRIISFWVKTSDMSGNTAATLTLKDKNNDDVTSNFKVDTTDVVTDLDDERKDIYHGWVQCFFFVENNDDEKRDLSFEFSFGNTELSATKVSSYKAGWAMLSNLQTLSVNEDTYAYTSAGTYSAELTLSKDDKSYTGAFDEPYGSLAHEIEEGMVDPSKYYGVNGGSSAIKNNGSISLPYDDINQKDDAGLINKEYVENYRASEWYKALLSAFKVEDKSTISAIETWEEMFGKTTYQPLVILNSLRTVGDKQVRNYGFIGTDSSASADGYSVVSVRVLVSAGAVAYVYLVDTAEGKKVMSFETPSLSFYYDEDGNVLYKQLDDDATLAERKANILYTLRSDGLYEDKDGKLFANTWNYTKLYKDESVSYYNEAGELVSFEDLVEGETYYTDATKTKQVNHFLVTSEGVKIFEYKDGAYYYIVEGKTQSDVITPFDISKARYAEISAEYQAVVDARYSANGKFMEGELGYDADGNKVAGKWVTVSFIIHTGSAAKNYRLELWSGAREEADTQMSDNSAVVFDYSYAAASDNTLRDWYENEIIKAYQRLLRDKGLYDELAVATSEENISYYEALVHGGKVNGEEINGFINDGKLSQADIDKYEILNNYKAHYYTFSLFDSANFRPFNEDTADENTTGYNYKVSDYSESLAYLEVKDYGVTGNTYTVFVDYATVDQSIEFVTAEDDDKEEETEDNDTNVWLLASSILLVVAMLFAMLAILIKDMLKKKRRNKTLGKNTYNHDKAIRTMKRLKIKPEEIEEVEPSENEDTTDTEE